MAQTTLFKAISTVTESAQIYVNGSDSVTIQCTPDASSGFSGSIVIDGAFVPNPGHGIVFPIVTFPIPPWFELAILDFSAHGTTLVFTVSVSGAWTWLRARVVAADVGSISLHMAY